MHLNGKMNLSVLFYLTVGLTLASCRVAPQTKAAENKDKRGAISGSYGTPSSSLSYTQVGSPSSYESSSSYVASPSNLYGAPSSYSPSESSSSYSDASYSNPGYGSSSDYSSSNSGFKPIPSSAVDHSTSSVSYGQSPSLTAAAYHPQTFSAVLPSSGLDYSSSPYGSFGLSGLGGYGGFASAYPYTAFGGFGQGLGALHYPRLMTAIPISGISSPYAAGVPIHGDYSSLTAAPIAPVSLPLYPSASLYSSPISPNFHSLSSSSYTPSQYSSPSYSSNLYGGSSLSSYSSQKPYASTYSSSSDYSSSSKYASPVSSSYPSTYSSSSYSSPSISSSYNVNVPPYSRYPTASRDSYSGSSSYSSPYKSSHSKDYNY